MAAVPTLIFAGLALWTAVSFVVAVVLGHAMRRLEPVPVRASARRVVDQPEGFLHHRRELVGKRRLVMAQARLAEGDQGRVDRLVRAAFRPEGDPARGGDEEEARVLVASIIETIEAAGDERVVERSNREQTRSEQVAG